MITKKSLQNLSALMILLAVGRYQSKRKVAEATNTSIDTVNKYISNLEYALGTRLVVNNTKGCRLTRQGMKVAEQVKDVPVILDRVCNQRSSSNLYKGDVCVCVPLLVSSCRFPFDFSELYDLHPDINVVSFSTIEPPQCREIGADVGVVTCAPEAVPDFSLLYTRKIKYSFFAARKYLDKYGCPKDMEDLLTRYRMVVCLQNADHIPGWDELMQSARKVCFSSTSTFSVVEAIRYGLGIGLLPWYYEDQELVPLDNLDFHFEMPVCLMINNGTKDIPRVRVVAECYQKALSRM